jgi:predicted PhzF superfamily epimerase YddE/YHI9
MALPANICIDSAPPEWPQKTFAVTPVRILAGDRKYLVEVARERDVLEVQPNFGLLRRVADPGVILTARSDGPGHEIVSRYFASYVGVDEDPAAGSAHCCLVPYWSEILGKPSGLGRRRGAAARSLVE